MNRQGKQEQEQFEISQEIRLQQGNCGTKISANIAGRGNGARYLLKNGSEETVKESENSSDGKDASKSRTSSSRVEKKGCKGEQRVSGGE